MAYKILIILYFLIQSFAATRDRLVDHKCYKFVYRQNPLVVYLQALIFVRFFVRLFQRVPYINCVFCFRKPTLRRTIHDIDRQTHFSSIEQKTSSKIF